MNLILLPRTAPAIIIGIIWGGLFTLSSQPENFSNGIFLFLGFSFVGAEIGTCVWYNLEERKNILWRIILGGGIGVALAIFLDSPVEKTILTTLQTSLLLVSISVIFTILPKRTLYNTLKRSTLAALIALLYATFFAEPFDYFVIDKRFYPLIYAITIFMIAVSGNIIIWALFIYPSEKSPPGTRSKD